MGLKCVCFLLVVPLLHLGDSREYGKRQRPMIRGGTRGLCNFCLYDVFPRNRRGHIVDLLRVRSAVVDARVSLVEALDEGVWLMQIVSVEELQETLTSPIAVPHDVLTQDVRAVEGFKRSKALLGIHPKMMK